MEGLKKIVTQIASTPDSRLPELPFRHRSLIPFLSFASSLYRLSLSLRRHLYAAGLLRQHRLPVPVISVGNLTWGGNGKTPMTEFIARVMDAAGVSPLILSRGYAGGDEAKMLQRHLLQTSARVGVGANRGATAASLFKKYGYIDSQITLNLKKHSCHQKHRHGSENEEVGIVILDDGMQHWSLLRDVEIVMLNGLMPWGNGYLLPRGSLREHLSALSRADIVVIHHADLVSDKHLKHMESTVQKVSEKTLPIFFSKLGPSYLFEVKNHHLELPLSVVQNLVALCVSAIGCPDAFIQTIKQMGALHVDRLDYSDHHFIQVNDIEMIREKLKTLEDKFEVEAVVVVTEKDYDRDPSILKNLDRVLVLCSSLQIMPLRGQAEESFITTVERLVSNRSGNVVL